MRGLNSRLKGGGSLAGLHGGLCALVCMQGLRGVTLIEFSAWYASTRTIHERSPPDIITQFGGVDATERDDR